MNISDLTVLEEILAKRLLFFNLARFLGTYNMTFLGNPTTRQYRDRRKILSGNNHTFMVSLIGITTKYFALEYLPQNTLPLTFQISMHCYDLIRK